MFQKGTILKNPVDFDNAMYFGIPVSVWQDGELIDYGGKITKQTEDAVYINDGYYLKSVCEFIVR